MARSIPGWEEQDEIAGIPESLLFKLTEVEGLMDWDSTVQQEVQQEEAPPD